MGNYTTETIIYKGIIKWKTGCGEGNIPISLWLDISLSSQAQQVLLSKPMYGFCVGITGNYRTRYLALSINFKVYRKTA